MDKNELLKGLKQSNRVCGDIQILNKDQKINVGCASCGKCCRNRNDILLKPNDIHCICNKLNINILELIRQYCDIYVGNVSHMPIISIKFKEKQNGESFCPFLKASNDKFKCKIHDSKPDVCRIYPLGRVMREGGGSLEYFLQPIDCDGEKYSKQIDIKDWIGNDYEINEQFFIEYHDIMSTLRKKINLEKMWKVSKEKNVENIVMSAMIRIIYYTDISLSLSEALHDYKTSKDSKIEHIININKKYSLGALR